MQTNTNKGNAKRVHLRIKYMLYLVVPVTLLNKTTHPNTKIKHKDVIKVDQAKIKLYMVKHNMCWTPLYANKHKQWQ
jgi:uncharacterized protein YchJ